MASSNLLNTPSMFEMYPVALPPGSASKSSPTSLTVQEAERTTLTVMCSGESTSIVLEPGFSPSAGMKSVCFHPHASHSMVSWVCSPKYGISDV